MRQTIEDTAFMLKLALVVFVGQGLMLLMH
jgi:hypothetical protein